MDQVTVVKAPRRLALEEPIWAGRELRAAAGPHRAVVFGSWARGSADARSDPDLAEELPTDCEGSAG